MATPVLTFVAVERNRNLRPNCVATAVLFLSVASIAAQTAGRSQAHARIAGRVLDEQGHPLKNISVHAVQDETGMYKPAVDSNEDGHFPKAGVLRGTVFDKATGKVITSPHSVHFIVRKVSNREDSIEFAGPTRFRWLIPPATDVMLEVFAEGYKRWFYSDSSDPLTPIPLRLESSEERILNIELEPETEGKLRPRQLALPYAPSSRRD